jgi:high-affinity iron transporter
MFVNSKVRSLTQIATAMLLSAVVAAPALADPAAAASNYTSFCLKCHGEAGKGDGPAASTLKTKPRDFTNCAQMSGIKDDTLFKVIKEGGGAAGLSADMPAWKDGFEDPDIKDLVAYVRTFCKK